MDHTKEPWKADGTIIYADYGIQTHIADLKDFTNTPESNAKRIADCVTACAGMLDPDEEISWFCNKVDTQEAELSSLRSALAIAQARIAECSDREALLADNVELRASLMEKTAQVEILREALTNIHDYGLDRDGEHEAEKLGKLIDELVQLAREALAETAPGATK